MRDQVMYSNNFVKLNFKKKKLVLWKLIFTSVFYYRQKIVCFQWWWYDQHLKKNVFDRLFFQKQLECKKTSGSDQLVFLHPSGKNQRIHRTHPKFGPTFFYTVVQSYLFPKKHTKFDNYKINLCYFVKRILGTVGCCW